MSSKQNNPVDLILETSLQGFFFDQLNDINSKSETPLSREVIYYSSRVMDELAVSQKYFEIKEGKIRDKILGIKFLESFHLSKSRQVEEFRNIGDTALILCGFFADSLKDKITDSSYYHNLGRSAYSRLDNLVPGAFDINGFFGYMSLQFDAVTTLLNIVSQKMKESSQDNFFLSFSISKSIKAS